MAMDTMVVSSRIMKNPMHSAESAAQGLARQAIGVLLALEQGQLGKVSGLVAVRPGNPAGFQVGDELFGPVQFGLSLVVGEGVVGPVQVRQVLGQDLVDEYLVGGDAG